jgi:hypothetical protein
VFRLRHLVEQMFDVFARSVASGSRSTVLHSLHWLFAIVLAALMTALRLNGPWQLLLMLSICAGAAFVLDCFAFVYFMFVNPDALRTERFTLEKMRLEKGLMGDTLSGLRELKAGEVVDGVTQSQSGERH